MASGQGDPVAPASLMEYFDFVERDMNQELNRLEAWIDEFAIAPLDLPQYFTVRTPQTVRVMVRTPTTPGWAPLPDNSAPILVFNYGKLLVHMQGRTPRTWICPHRDQVVLPLRQGATPGELMTEVTLPTGRIWTRCSDSGPTGTQLCERRRRY